MNSPLKLISIYLLCLSTLVTLNGCTDYGQLNRDRSATLDERDKASTIHQLSGAELKSLEDALALLDPNSPAWLVLSQERQKALDTTQRAASVVALLDQRLADIDAYIEASTTRDTAAGNIIETVGTLLNPLTVGISGVVGTALAGFLGSRRGEKKGAAVVAETIAVARANIPQLNEAFNNMSQEQRDTFNYLYGHLATTIQSHKDLRTIQGRRIPEPSFGDS
jgi:hypothetical protein